VEAMTSTVLVVEDDGHLRKAVARTLSARGHRVVAAASCCETLQHPGPFAVGIFDIALGDGDGVALATDLLRRGRVARAIFFTGSVDVSQVTRAAEIGTVVSKGQGMAPLLRALW
jgi:DNA-binding NtrC family response regulator